MPTIRVVRSIAAPLELVFTTVADITQFRQAIPHIVNVEFLSATRSGVGTRFRETRLMNGKEMPTELEVTEYVKNDRIRLVADSHGTIWDTLFTVRSDQGRTELTMVMEAKGYKLLAKIMNLLICRLVAKAVEQDMDSVKTFCENRPK